MIEYDLGNSRDVARLTAKLDKVGKNIPRQVTVSAINKTLNESRKNYVRNVSRVTGIKQRPIRARTSVVKAKTRNISGVLYARQTLVKPEELGKVRQYGAKPGANFKTGKRGRRSKGGGIRAGRHKFPGAFIMRTGSSQTVMQRKGSRRLPIEKVGIDIRVPSNRAMRRVRSLIPRIYDKHFSQTAQKRIDKELDRK